MRRIILQMKDFDNSNVGCLIELALKRQKEILTSDGKPLLNDTHIHNLTKGIVVAGKRAPIPHIKITNY